MKTQFQAAVFSFGKLQSALLCKLASPLAKIALGASIALGAVHGQTAAPSAPSEVMSASTTNQDKRFSARSASFVSALQPSVQRALPAVTAREFAAVEKRAKPGTKALRIGIERELAAHSGVINLRDLVWVKVADGRSVAKLQLGSTGAKGLRLQLANAKDPLAASVQFRVAGSAAPQLVEGPFLISDFKSSVVWSAWTLGESMTLEAVLPAGANPFELKLAVKALAHMDKSLLNLEKLGACHRDVVCESGAAEISAALSVARYTYQANGGSFTCTGTLMNDNDPNSLKQLFLSAQHCLSTAAEANTVTSLWYEQASSCGGSGRDARYVQVGGGATILAMSSNQDMLLMELRGTAPSTAVLAAWDAATIAGSPSMMVVHHPDGDWKKISRANFNGFGTWEVAGQNTHLSTLYTQGSTEPGSSGSTIRTLSGGNWIVRGTLSGGGATCTNFAADDRYGRLDLATAVVAVLNSGGSNPPPPPPPTGDIAGSTSTTATIASGATASSTIDIAGDQDWFRISLTAGTNYTFKMDGSSAGAGGGSLGDPFLRLLNSSGQELASNDDISEAASNFNSQINFLATSTGTYYLSAQAFQTDTGTYRLSVTSSAPPPPPPPPTGFTPQTGWWWDSAAGGQGFGIEILNGRLFIGGFLYDNVGNPIWFVSNGAMRSSSVYFGTMTQYYSGQTLTGNFIAPSSSTTHGGVLITFTSATTATMDWPGGTKQLSRFPISGGVVTAPAANMPQRGWYVSPGEAGRGWMVEVQGDKLFIAGFMYNNNGYPIWYLSSGTMTNANFFSGVWQNFGSGQTYTSPWAAPGAVLTNSNAGSLTLNFGTSTTGSLTLPNGKIIPLVRFTDF